MSDDRIYTQADLEAAVSVVRAERDEAREQVWQQEDMLGHARLEVHERLGQLRLERDAAEADLRALREGLEALADEWAAWCDDDWSDQTVYRTHADVLRALLASSPAEGEGDRDLVARRALITAVYRTGRDLVSLDDLERISDGMTSRPSPVVIPSAEDGA